MIRFSTFHRFLRFTLIIKFASSMGLLYSEGHILSGHRIFMNDWQLVFFYKGSSGKRVFFDFFVDLRLTLSRGCRPFPRFESADSGFARLLSTPTADLPDWILEPEQQPSTNDLKRKTHLLHIIYYLQ